MDRSLEEANKTSRTKSIDIQTSNIDINSQNDEGDEYQSQQDNDDNNQQQDLDQDYEQQDIMYNNEQELNNNEFQEQNVNEQSEDQYDQEQFKENRYNQDIQTRNGLAVESFDYEKHIQGMQSRQPQVMKYEQQGLIDNHLKQQNIQEAKSQANDPAYAITDKKINNDFISEVSDKKIWAISGKMPGSVSKKFIRSYKLGRYNKFKSLKSDQEYFNSPHHEQLHLGNGIFPFQNNITRIQTAGSFDYRKLTQQKQNGNSQISLKMKTLSNFNQGTHQQVNNNQKQSLNNTIIKNKDINSTQQVYSPRTTANTVRQQIMQQNNQQNSPNLYQQMEIKYIDIISQPIVKQTNFINNNKCPHGLTNIRNEKKNLIFMKNNQNSNTQMDYYQTPQQLKSSKTQHNLHQSYKTHGYDVDEHEMKFQDLFFNKIYKDPNNLFDEQSHQYNENHYSTNSLLPVQNIIFQPKNVIINNYANQRAQSSYSLLSRPQTTYHQGLQSRQSQRSKKVTHQQLQQPRLPLFAANPDNISFLPKAKQNLVKYVNQIGTQDNPLKNTFVSKKKVF